MLNPRRRAGLATRCTPSQHTRPTRATPRCQPCAHLFAVKQVVRHGALGRLLVRLVFVAALAVLRDGALHQHLLRVPLLSVQLSLQANKLDKVKKKAGGSAPGCCTRVVGAQWGCSRQTAMAARRARGHTFLAIADCRFGSRASFLRLRSKWSMR